MQLGIGNSNNPILSVSWQPSDPPETCPYCGARGSTGWATIGGVDYIRCTACDTAKPMSEWRADEYGALLAAPDITF